MLTIANIWGWVYGHKKFVGILTSCVVGLLLLWYLLTQATSCYSSRQIDKARANVNAALANLANAQSNLAVSKADEARRIEEVKIATNTALEAANATEAAKTTTNAVLANLNAAINANVPLGTSAEDLQKRLDDLDR